MTLILTLCQSLFEPETPCHSGDKTSQHSRSPQPRDRVHSDDQDADFTPRHSTSTKHADFTPGLNTPTRRAKSFSKSSCKQDKSGGIIDVGGEDALVAIGIGALCIIAGVVIGHELSSRDKRDTDGR